MEKRKQVRRQVALCQACVLGKDVCNGSRDGWEGRAIVDESNQLGSMRRYSEWHTTPRHTRTRGQLAEAVSQVHEQQVAQRLGRGVWRGCNVTQRAARQLVAGKGGGVGQHVT